MNVIKDFTYLKDLLPEFKEYDCIVIIAGYNFGKSSICTDTLYDFFGQKNAYYATFSDQSKPGFIPRKSRLKFGQLVKNKIIIFDEISDDNNRDVRAFLKELINSNKVIILSNPYGSSNNPEKEMELFYKTEKEILPEKTMFVFVKDSIG